MRNPTVANLRRSATMKGRPKSLEMRAALHASRYVNKQEHPHAWRRLYETKLDDLRRKESLLELLDPEEPTEKAS